MAIVRKSVARTDILICARVDGDLLLPDNKTGRCAECNQRIQFRPHGAKATKKICIQCAGPLVTDPRNTIGTTPKMLDDYQTWLRRQKQ